MARKKMTKAQRTRQIYIRIAFLLAILVIGITVLLVFLLGNSKIPVDLNERTHITLTGFNGDGVLSASLDVDDAYSEFYDTVDIEFSRSSGLSNGDEITISYTYDKEVAKALGLKITVSDMHYTVANLIDPVEVSKEEMFEGVGVNFEGIAPMVEATLTTEANEFSDIISYEIVGDRQYYDEGDTVQVRAVFEEEDLAERDCVAEVPSEECIKEYTVEGVDRYITDIDDITDEMIASFKQEALTLFTDANEYGMRIFCDAGLVPVYINKKTTFVWNSPNYISSYLNVLKEENLGKTGAHVNDIKLCYEAVISQADGKACKAEVVVRFQNIIKRSDGTIELNLESGDIISADRRDSHIKAIVNNASDDDYESEKLPV